MAIRNHRIVLENIIENLHEQRAPHIRLHQYFELFAAEQILKEYQITDEQLEEGNPGGTGDGGVDGAHLFIHGTWVNEENVDNLVRQLRRDVNIDFHVIQAKYKDNLESDVIDKFSSLSDDLFDLNKDLNELSQFYNDSVIAIFETFRKAYSKLAHTFPVINITFSYVTKGGLPNDNMTRKANQLCEKVKNQILPGSNCDFQFVGAVKLFDLYRRPPQKTFDLKIAEGPLSSDDSESFVVLIRLDEYYKFLTDENGGLRSRLFEANVRAWQGENRVNSQIQDSLEDGTFHNFWWLNNGVTILAAKATHIGGKTLELENPEIVNGLQTSQAIYNHFSDATRVSVDGRKLLARIIQIADERESREKIIRATNSQTLVPEDALRSLDDIHRTIEVYFSRQEPPMYYDRQSNTYKLRGMPKNRIFSIRRLTQSFLATVQFCPDDALKRPSNYLRTDTPERLAKYNFIFDADHPLALYYFCARFYVLVDNLLNHEKCQSKYDRGDRTTVKFHVMTHAILRHVGLRRNRIDSPVKLISRYAEAGFGPLSVEMILDSAIRVLEVKTRMQEERPGSRFSWRDFEDKVFEDLDSLLAQQKSK